MNAPEYQALLEASWRRELTAAEAARLEAHWADHPEGRAEWLTEATLNRALRGLPNAPLASNFTAQVLQAVERERTQPKGRPAPSQGWKHWIHGFWHKAAWCGAALLILAGALQEYRYLNRTEMARDLAKIPAVATLPSPEILQDYDAIQVLAHVPAVPRNASTVSDDDLLAALQ